MVWKIERNSTKFRINDICLLFSFLGQQQSKEMVLTNLSLKSNGALTCEKWSQIRDIVRPEMRGSTTKYIYIPRVPQCLSPCWNWDPPPLPQAIVLPPGVYTRLRVRGWGSPNSDDWRECLVLCLYDTCTIQLVSNSDNIFKVFYIN